MKSQKYDKNHRSFHFLYVTLDLQGYLYLFAAVQFSFQFFHISKPFQRPESPDEKTDAALSAQLAGLDRVNRVGIDS